jgi:hypothetical protein
MRLNRIMSGSASSNSTSKSSPGFRPLLSRTAFGRTICPRSPRFVVIQYDYHTWRKTESIFVLPNAWHTIFLLLKEFWWEIVRKLMTHFPKPNFPGKIQASSKCIPNHAPLRSRNVSRLPLHFAAALLLSPDRRRSRARRANARTGSKAWADR